MVVCPLVIVVRYGDMKVGARTVTGQVAVYGAYLEVTRQVETYNLDQLLVEYGPLIVNHASEAIRQVAEANGIYYIPFGSGLGLGLYRELSGNLYNIDGIHHTDLGGYDLAQGIWCYLKDIPLWYDSMPE